MRGTADILVVGAGPTGLALALQAHDHDAAVRIVDRRTEAARPSRALILHSRTLEVLRPLEVTQALLARADITPTADLQLGSRLVRVTLADLALPDTAFPHLSLIRQMEVERVLAEALADRGVQIERGTELTGLCDETGGVRVLLRSPARVEVCALISFGLLTLALRHLEVGAAYAVWTGIGAAGTALVGMALLGESVSAAKLVSIALILAGVIGLNLSGVTPP